MEMMVCVCVCEGLPEGPPLALMMQREAEKAGGKKIYRGRMQGRLS